MRPSSESISPRALSVPSSCARTAQRPSRLRSSAIATASNGSTPAEELGPAVVDPRRLTSTAPTGTTAAMVMMRLRQVPQKAA